MPWCVQLEPTSPAAALEVPPAYAIIREQHRLSLWDPYPSARRDLHRVGHQQRSQNPHERGRENLSTLGLLCWVPSHPTTRPIEKTQPDFSQVGFWFPVIHVFLLVVPAAVGWALVRCRGGLVGIHYVSFSVLWAFGAKPIGVKNTQFPPIDANLHPNGT